MWDIILFIVIVAVLVFLYMRWQASQSFKDPGTSKPVITDENRHKEEEEMRKAREAGDHEMIILYATQTGTAQTFSKTLFKEAKRYGVKPAMCDVEAFNQDDLHKQKLVIFIVSTYGEGEPCDPAKEFHEWFMSGDCENFEHGQTSFAVFGLGDKQYPHFCEMGIQADKRMAQLGAKRIIELGKGDASTDIEVEFDIWRSNLWPAVGNALGKQLKCDSDEPQLPETTLRYIDGEDAAALPFPKAAASIAPNLRQPAWVPIAGHSSLLKRSTPDRETMLIRLDINGTALTYVAGDHLAVLPHNSDEHIDRYLKILNISAEESKRVIALADNKTRRNQLPAWVTVRDALKWYVDLCGKPKRSVLRVLAHYAQTTEQRDALLGLLRMSDEAQAEFHTAERALRDVGGFLTKYGCGDGRVPLGHFLEVMPRLQPRWFSIASDQLHTKSEIHIVVAVVDQGVCTTMLRNMQTGDNVCVYVRKSTFHLNRQNKTRPIICVGPGTGVAPLIGFMARREAWRARNNEVGKCFFYFGCRRRDEDYIYEKELEAWKASGIITELNVAFSRETEEKVYVQHLLKRNAEQTWKCLREEHGTLFICGDAKNMAKDVMNEIAAMAVKFGNMNQDQAATWIQQLEKDARLHKDVWSA